MIGYVDSDFAGDTNDRKSQTGYVFWWNGCPISWRSQKQSVVALSSTEAELVAAVEATREAVAIRTLLGELGIEPSRATAIFEDNNGALLLSKGHIGGARTKHISIKYHYVAEQSRKGVISLVRVDSQNNHADPLTKPLPIQAHKSHLNYLTA